MVQRRPVFCVPTANVDAAPPAAFVAGAGSAGAAAVRNRGQQLARARPTAARCWQTILLLLLLLLLLVLLVLLLLLLLVLLLLGWVCVIPKRRDRRGLCWRPQPRGVLLLLLLARRGRLLACTSHVSCIAAVACAACWPARRGRAARPDAARGGRCGVGTPFALHTAAAAAHAPLPLRLLLHGIRTPLSGLK
jgi:hypothetical protein